jgi:hypothetical protein
MLALVLSGNILAYINGIEFERGQTYLINIHLFFSFSMSWESELSHFISCCIVALSSGVFITLPITVCACLW